MHSKQYKITIADIARETGLPQSTVRRHRAEGRLVMDTRGISEYIVGWSLIRKRKPDADV